MAFQIILIVALLSFMFYTMWKDKRHDKIEEERLEQQRIIASRKVSEEKFHNPKIPAEEKLQNLHYLQLQKDKETVKKLSYNTEDILLTELLLHINRNFGYLIQSLTIMNKGIVETYSQDEIRSYKVLDAIIRDKKFICDQAMILIKYVNVDNELADKFIATLTLEAKEENEECLMVRATVSMPPIDRQGLHYNACTFSMMLSIDKMEKRQKQACFEYLLKEALDAGSDNLYTLNPSQLEMLSLQDTSPARDLFFGNKYFSEKRYYNALLHLESAYENMHNLYFHLNDYWRKVFFDVCYKIGYCFCDMQNYSNAIFYLELADSQNYIIYSVEYINALVNSRDIRAIYNIDRTMDRVQKQISDAAANGREVDSDLAVFYNFLRRRKGHTLIDWGDLNTAEEMFKQMVNEPANHDHAVNELNHIAELRQRQKSQKDSDK